jgi:hypothetical protein
MDVLRYYLLTLVMGLPLMGLPAFAHVPLLIGLRVRFLSLLSRRMDDAISMSGPLAGGRRTRTDLAGRHTQLRFSEGW